jgi:2-polyprenyl-3-methyl-5-hydroxy-6-metoxy-1,4-benzoquinol methylase
VSLLLCRKHSIAQGSAEKSTVDESEIKKFGAIGKGERSGNCLTWRYRTPGVTHKLLAGWWDPKGEMKPLHSYNRLRVGFLDSMVAQNVRLKADDSSHHADTSTSTSSLRGIKVVDVGCGGGILAVWIAGLDLLYFSGIMLSRRCCVIAGSSIRRRWLRWART